jgi:hypothetical protein
MRMSPSRADFRRYRQATSSERAGWLKALAAVALTRVGIELVSVERLAARLGVAVCRGEAQPHFTTSAPVVATATRVRAVLKRWPCASPCLVGALATGLLLRDLKPTLFIGVRKRGDAVMAHAWLDVADGRVPLMLPDDSSDFVRLRRSGAG